MSTRWTGQHHFLGMGNPWVKLMGRGCGRSRVRSCLHLLLRRSRLRARLLSPSCMPELDTRPSDPNSRAESSAKQVWTQASRGRVARRAHPCPEQSSQVCRREGKARGPKSCEWRQEVSLTGRRDSDPRAKRGLGGPLGLQVGWLHGRRGRALSQAARSWQPGPEQKREETGSAPDELESDTWGRQVPTEQMEMKWGSGEGRGLRAELLDGS